MYARLTTTQGTPAKIEDGIRVLENDVIPGMKKLDGFKHGYWSVDRKSGKMVSLTLFENEKDLLASDAAVATLRKTATDKLGFETKNVEQFEIIARA